MSTTRNQDITSTLVGWRAATGLSQARAAERLGVPFGTYMHWESGDRRPGAAARRLIEQTVQEQQIEEGQTD